jgi:hypothetical protein
VKLGDLYKKVVALGMAADPRGKKKVAAELERVKKAYEGLTDKEKELFDLEKLTNPYADTRIAYGDPETDVAGLLVGVDIGVGEILLADRLRSKGVEIGAIVSHHPEGRAMAQFYEVMHMQADILQGMGVPINVAEGILSERIKEVSRRVLPVNHTRAQDAARELDIPLVCVHTPSDNMVASNLQKLFDRKKPDRLEDILEILLGIPEYRRAAREVTGPSILVGQKENRTGRVFVDMTGGTEGSKEVFSRLATTEVGTVVSMHYSEEHIKEAGKNHVNVVVAGHIPSDNMGLNLTLDRLTEKEDLSIRGCSGFFRVDRRKAPRR